jgi:hypothetical protein
MLGRAFWSGVIELARWLCSGAFAWWGLGLVLLALRDTDFSQLRLGSFASPDDPRVIAPLPLGAILILVSVLLFLQFGRAKRALLRTR